MVLLRIIDNCRTGYHYLKHLKSYGLFIGSLSLALLDGNGHHLILFAWSSFRVTKFVLLYLSR